MLCILYLFHCRDDLDDFIEVGVYGGKMSVSVPLLNYKVVIMSASQDMAEAEIEVTVEDFLFASPLWAKVKMWP